MAYKMTKSGSLDNEITNEFFCDTAADLDKIPSNQINLGSVAVVVDGMEVFIANSNKEWHSIFSIENSNEENEEATITNIYSGTITKALALRDSDEEGDYYIVPALSTTNNTFMVCSTTPLNLTIGDQVNQESGLQKAEYSQQIDNTNIILNWFSGIAPESKIFLYSLSDVIESNDTWSGTIDGIAEIQIEERTNIEFNSSYTTNQDSTMNISLDLSRKLNDDEQLFYCDSGTVGYQIASRYDVLPSSYSLVNNANITANGTHYEFTINLTKSDPIFVVAIPEFQLNISLSSR